MVVQKYGYTAFTEKLIYRSATDLFMNIYIYIYIKFKVMKINKVNLSIILSSLCFKNLRFII